MKQLQVNWNGIMNKIVILMMVIVLAGCTASTPEPTPTATLTLVPTETPEPTATFTQTPEPTREDIKATVVNIWSNLYEKHINDSDLLKCESVSWVDDEFKTVCKYTGWYSREIVFDLQYRIVKGYAEIFAGDLRKLAGPDFVVKIIFTTGDFDRQIMSITRFSTLEKIKDGRITEVIEWVQEAEITGL